MRCSTKIKKSAKKDFGNRIQLKREVKGIFIEEFPRFCGEPKEQLVQIWQVRNLWKQHLKEEIDRMLEELESIASSRLSRRG